MAVIDAPPRTRPAPPPPPPPDSGLTPSALWWAGLTLAVVVALILSMVAVGVAIGRTDSAGGTVGTPAKQRVGPPQTFTIELGDIFVKPSQIEATPGRPVVLKVTNTGQVAHDLQLEGGRLGTGLLHAGTSKTVNLGPLTSDLRAWCTVVGHREAGMVLNIKMKGASAKAASEPTADATPAAAIDFNATPAADWKPFDPNLAPAEGGTEHAIAVHATETVLEVAPGVKQEMWTFGGRVPGPILRGHVGDVFTVTLTNDGKLGHSIDFHASKTAMNVNMRTLQPGESLVYQFKADYAGIWMYHCGTAPALHHIGNGMFGAVIIDPPGLPPVDHEYVLVQSELYLGPPGKPGDLQKMQKVAFDAVTFNGYVSQYKFAPIQVGLHQRSRVWVLDAGPSENASFHIVGTIFDTVYKEGGYVLRPGDGRGGAQALDLQPAQGGFVEFTLDEPGNYAIVTHKFANVGKGALGLFQVPGAEDVASH